MEKKIINAISLILLFTFSGIFGTYAQENDLDNFRTSFELTSLKQTDNSRLLRVEYTGINKEDKKDIVAVMDAEVNFYNILEDEEILLGKSMTNKEGVVSIVVPAEHKYLKDKDGYISVVAKYDGNDIMDSEVSELMFKDLFLDIKLDTIENVRTLTANAYTLDMAGEKQNVEELDIVLGVEGMLSKLVLEESTLEEGVYEYEIPEDIHGNAMGELTLFAKVDDHEDFGNVIKTVTIIDTYAVVKSRPERNKLWTQAAPIWMYVVLSILLIGVWSNYIYAIWNLIKIRKMRKA